MVKTTTSHEEITVLVDAAGKRTLTSGMKCWHKLFNLLFIIIPKMLIAVWLFIVGSVFIAFSENDETVLLNTLAVYFIVEVDQFIFTVFTPKFVKKALTSMPPLVKRDSQFANYQTMFGLVFGNLFAIALVGVGAAVMLEVSCGGRKHV